LTRIERYQRDCYDRSHFYTILFEGLGNFVPIESKHGKDKFTFFIENDSLDFTIWSTQYPGSNKMIKEILIINWAGGWEHKQQSLHIEYWDNVWKMKSLSRKITQYPHATEGNEKVISKEEIFPEISKFIMRFDEGRSKLLNRSFNLTQI